jgi:hypothetical protein
METRAFCLHVKKCGLEARFPAKPEGFARTYM